MGKGEQTRTAILDEALKIASRLGLEGLTIGSLADATGMSKSGLFAHFGSREDLQLAVLEHFAQLYGERVFVPVLKIERGLPRLRALFERWLDWTIASGLPGGCIMISAANEYDDRPGPIRDAVIANQHRGNAITQKAVRLAVEEGHLRADTDPEQIAFEMLGIMLASHNHRRLLGDKEARKRALTAFEELVARHAAAPKRALRAASR
ncbi:MAG TPA: TetR/AcrR family transcriptional regulator [Burkholderiales bacterium]|jgi:AcrR family transcriptional regulator|nr:TetR/AcrR family transcriptional regulator [Burkholderiales bacterium]